MQIGWKFWMLAVSERHLMCNHPKDYNSSAEIFCTCGLFHSVLFCLTDVYFICCKLKFVSLCVLHLLWTSITFFVMYASSVACRAYFMICLSSVAGIGCIMMCTSSVVGKGHFKMCTSSVCFVLCKFVSWQILWFMDNLWFDDLRAE